MHKTLSLTLLCDIESESSRKEMTDDKQGKILSMLTNKAEIKQRNVVGLVFFCSELSITKMCP